MWAPRPTKLRFRERKPHIDVVYATQRGAFLWCGKATPKIRAKKVSAGTFFATLLADCRKTAVFRRSAAGRDHININLLSRPQKNRAPRKSFRTNDLSAIPPDLPQKRSPHRARASACKRLPINARRNGAPTDRNFPAFSLRLAGVFHVNSFCVSSSHGNALSKQ